MSGQTTGEAVLPRTRDPLQILAVAVAVVAVAGGLILRFWTRSDLWLDEALTVNISRLPLGRIPSALRHDGSPPLFYFLLHLWMKLFGTGDRAVRSLSGAFGVISLPLAYLSGRRLGGRLVGLTAVVLVATSPFAVRYSTEARMYMMIVALTLVGYLALDSTLRRPTRPRLAAVALVSGLLALSHYWSFYLIGAVVLMLAWMGRPGRTGSGAGAATADRARAARAAAVAVIAGTVILLAPWGGILLFQLRHTGTPWSTPTNFAAMVNAISDFAGGGSNQGRALGLIFFALAGVGLFGRAVDRVHIDLDLRTRADARAVAWVSVATLVLGIIAGRVTHSAYSARYTAVMFAVFVLLLALGITRFADRRIGYGILAACMALGLLSSTSNVTTNRTQAGVIVRAIEARGGPGDVVVYCPDQLGPAADRLLRGPFVQVTYPRYLPADRVDWVDYAKVNESSHPAAFAQRVLAQAGPHNIWLVWSPDYLTFQGKCDKLEEVLAAHRPHSKAILLQKPARYYEHANLVRYWAS